MIAGVILTGILGIGFIVMGCLLWLREKIGLLHDYHYDKVSGKNKKAFCRLSGWGVIAIGLGMLATAVILTITDSAWSFMAFAAGFSVGLALLIHAGRKYNR